MDINDLTIVLANYNKSSGASAGGIQAVPEPGSLVLLAAAVLRGLAGTPGGSGGSGSRGNFGRRVYRTRRRSYVAARRGSPVHCVFGLFGVAAVSAATPYLFTNLGALPSQSYGYGMGPGGAVVGGYGKGATAMNTFLYSGGTMSTLSNGATGCSIGYAANASGQVAGVGDARWCDDPAFWSSSMRGADQPGAAPCGECEKRVRLCHGVSNSGQVVGYCSDSGGNIHAFLWRSPAAWWTWAPVAARPATRRPSIRSRGTSWAVQQTPVRLALFLQRQQPRNGDQVGQYARPGLSPGH